MATAMHVPKLIDFGDDDDDDVVMNSPEMAAPAVAAETLLIALDYEDPSLAPLRAGLQAVSLRAPTSEGVGSGIVPREPQPRFLDSSSTDIVVRPGGYRVIKKLKTAARRAPYWRDSVTDKFAQFPSNRPPRIYSYRPGKGPLHSSRFAPQAGELIMADIDDRRDNRGRGRGGYAGQKRRHREDDDGYDRPQRHHQRQEPLSVVVRRQILAVAENPMTQASDDLIAIASTITSNYDDEIFRNIISDLVVQLVLEQPLKIAFVAALILYVNEGKPDFTKIVLEKTAAKTQSAVEAGQWRSFKLLLRFLGCLQDLFEGDGILGLLDELFNRAVDLQTASSEDALGLELVKIIMFTLPYVIAFSQSSLNTQAAEILEKTGIIASAPRETETVVDPFIRVDGSESPKSQSLLSLLHAQLLNEAEQDWPLTVIPRLFTAQKKENDASAEMTDEDPSASKHALPALIIPETMNQGPKPLFPELYFSVYADQDYETVPSTSNIASLLIRDALVDTIDILDFNRIEAARFLLNVDCYWTPESFVRRSTPFDKLKEIPEGMSTWKPEDLIIDAVFSQIMQLPAPEHKVVFYHSMITEACKLAPSAIAPSLGRAIRYLYRNLDLMDEELVYRFMDWFSHHLSNWDFRWKWQEWVSNVEEDIVRPQKSFIVGALHKEMRLSFASRIRQTVPEEYQELIPSSMDNEIPEYKFNDALTPFSAEVKPLIKLVRKKNTSDSDAATLAAVETLRNAVSGSDDSSDPDLVVVDAFATTICYVGSKSLSHVLSFIERNKTRLLELSTCHPLAKHQIISSVVAYWQSVQPGIAVTIVDKLLNYAILTPESVIEWALGPERLRGGRGLAESWVYEMVSHTVRKVTNRVGQIVSARTQAQLKPAVASELESTLVAETERMRSLFAIVDDALKGIAEGFDDALLEGGEGMTEDDDETKTALRLWGIKWRRVFARKLAVEEAGLFAGRSCFPVVGEEDEAMAGGVDGEVGVDAEAEANGDGVVPGVGHATNGGPAPDDMYEADLIQ